jgi:anthranilate phosphoribosyltransferase
VSLDEYDGWPGVLGRLMAGEDLPRPVARAAAETILAGEATPVQIGAFAVALRQKGESVDELTGVLEAMRAEGDHVPVDAAALGLVDTCGTGGDRSHSINVSTIAALVVVGAGGRVCKHGNRSQSSACGSADVLEELGVVIDLGPDGVAACIEEVGIGFCLAPRFHPAMRHAGPARRELGVPTLFNFLGPLANPALVQRQVVGVSDPAMAPRMTEVLAATGSQRAMVVHGLDGLDEISLGAQTDIVELRDGEVTKWRLDPAEMGLAPATIGDLRGGDAVVNAAAARGVLGGEAGPHRDVVVVNAAAALVVADVAQDLVDGVARAQQALDTGAAATALESLIEVSNRVAR